MAQVVQETVAVNEEALNKSHTNHRRMEGIMKTREYLAIKRRIDDFELSESLTRTKLLQGARAGNLAAINMLWERYNLRLPLVEQALKIQAAKKQPVRS